MAKPQIGHEGNEDQQHVRRDVREHHGVDQAEAGGHARGEQRRDPGQHIGAEEDAAENGGLDAVAEMEPVGQQALPTKPPAKASSAKRPLSLKTT